MIDLYVFPDVWGINPSPFCLKVETYCRLAGVPFRAIPTLPFRAPRGKLPFIDDGKDRVPDSGLIIDHLKRRYGDVLDRDLDAAQRAQGHLVRRSCEESFYFVLLYSRWIEPAGWKVIKPALFGSLPIPLRDAVAELARRSVRRALYAQGYGRHTGDQIQAIGAADLAALAATVTTQGFTVADHPTSYDAALYGALANILDAPIEAALKQEAQRHAALTGFVARMKSALARV